MTRDFNFDGNFDGSDIGLKRDDQRISRLVEITPIYKFAYNNNTTTIRKIRVSIYIYSIEKSSWRREELSLQLKEIK